MIPISEKSEKSKPLEINSRGLLYDKNRQKASFAVLPAVDELADSSADKLIFNRSVSLKDGFKKVK